MPWEDYHAYGFSYKHKSLFVCSQEFIFTKDEKLASKVKLSSYFQTPKDTISYLYDYGDNWIHTITLHKILEKDDKQKYPYCLKGSDAAPFEDCGGIWGYYEMLEIIGNPQHPEYQDGGIG